MNNTLAEEIPLEARTIARRKENIACVRQKQKIPYCDKTHKSINEQQGTQYASLKIWPEKTVTPSKN